jgi:hypothetical protein
MLVGTRLPWVSVMELSRLGTYLSAYGITLDDPATPSCVRSTTGYARGQPRQSSPPGLSWLGETGMVSPTASPGGESSSRLR